MSRRPPLALKNDGQLGSSTELSERANDFEWTSILPSARII
ncbi:MAG TPA: hypothetical protein VHE60_08425 [Pyrinomonadaceae bacterium]|nr:hypothetical protein [Pyrinomonadaceae bacterium]